MTRKTLLLPAILLVTLNLFLTSCGASHTNKANLSPAQTFTAFREAVKEQDVEGFKTFLAKRSLQFFEDHKGQKSLDEHLKGLVLPNLSEAQLNLLGGDNKIVDDRIDGDRASVLQVDRGGFKWPISFGLIKEDGEWKVLMPGTDK